MTKGDKNQRNMNKIISNFINREDLSIETWTKARCFTGTKRSWNEWNQWESMATNRQIKSIKNDHINKVRAPTVLNSLTHICLDLETV